MSPRISPVPLPAQALIATALPHTDYVDAYAVSVTGEAADDPVWLTRQFLEFDPPWVQALLRLRDILVRPFGLQNSGGLKPPPGSATFEVGSRTAIFTVLAHTADEILLRGEDRHLEACFSIWLDRRAERTLAVVTTTVRFHNALGRWYFAFVKPFHRLIVRAMLRRALSA